MIQDNTKHGLKIPHGLKTPHKLPASIDTSEDQEQFNQLTNLAGSLYPTGRSWYAPEGGVFKSLHQAINTSFLRLINSYKRLINSSIPDSDKFTEDDAKFLEYKYGISRFNNAPNLELRKAALRRKIGHPNNLKERQSNNFIESQLRLAGFNVRVYENTPPYIDPGSVTNISVNDTQHGGDTQHGDNTYHGGITFDVIANKINPDESYGVGSNLWASFFIGGESLGELAEVPQQRQREFRELVLKLKPAHLAAYIFVNFT